jgi:hypothetical protein
MADAPTIPDETEVRAKWGGLCYVTLKGDDL